MLDDLCRGQAADRRGRPRRSCPRRWPHGRARPPMTREAEPGLHVGLEVPGDLGIPVAVEMDGDAPARAGQDEMMPGLGADLGLAREDRRRPPWDEEEPARGAGPDEPPRPRVSPPAFAVPRAKRYPVTGRASFGKAVPEPELDGVGFRRDRSRAGTSRPPARCTARLIRRSTFKPGRSAPGRKKANRRSRSVPSCSRPVASRAVGPFHLLEPPVGQGREARTCSV